MRAAPTTAGTSSSHTSRRLFGGVSGALQPVHLTVRNALEAIRAALPRRRPSSSVVRKPAVLESAEGVRAGEKERNPSRLPATADSVALSTHRTPTIAPPAGKTPAKTPSHSIPAQRGRGGRGRPASNQAKLEARASLPLCPNEDLSTRGGTSPETKHCDPPASDENGPWRFRRTHDNPLSEDDRYPASFFVTQTVQSPIDRPVLCRRVEHKPRRSTRLLCDRSLALVTQHSVRQTTLGQRRNVAFSLLTCGR